MLHINRYNAVNKVALSSLCQVVSMYITLPIQLASMCEQMHKFAQVSLQNKLTRHKMQISS